MTPDPWQALSTDWPKIRVFIRYMPDKWGQTVWDGDRPHIELAHDLGPIQQRCTLAHELHHLEFGRPCGSFCGENEREVIEATARWLLPDVARVGAALHSCDIEAAARHLGVTRQVLSDRLCTLTEHEEIELADALTPGTAAQGVRAADGPRRHGRPVPPCRGNRTPDRPR